MNTKLESKRQGNAVQMSLAAALGLQPLDRVQINSAHEIAESRAFARYTNTQQDQPYLFFQRVVGDQLEVRSPGGYMTRVAPQDISDVVHGKPIAVMAMPQSVFIERLKLTSSQAAREPALPTDYAMAKVLYARKNRWGQAEFDVWFDDSVHNEVRLALAMLAPGEAQRLQKLARRTIMPVDSRTGGAGHSADFGLQRTINHDRHAAHLLLKAGCSGNAGAVSRLASLGVAPMTTGAMNRLIAG